ncbi:NAD(P)/FAD-dependent oxidoreductase [Permianibacter sp. IMCC34836]|uniref:NAD(P)/FAD-dependent oxidoreductase n=1 Tax=Permianibacter fluminis TaxID=2738515 RepID=UPI0015543863|nr:NAD(P)/FAD-dependent oxidoreductase [Permianibacter fluminis]NQD35686.1 NAD(P)/FAD-dependent oxidoreductase [Permianibacter fluminis]
MSSVSNERNVTAPTALPHVLIIGGGFAGLSAARALANAPARVTLIDRRNHHLFQPLLYQVAMAALNPSDVAYPIRAILRDQRNTQVLLAEARRIDLAQRRVELDNGALAYDYLIVASGASHSYFGNEHWATVAPGLKTIEDALDIRRRVFLAYEAAERERDALAQKAWQSFVVIGGGPTGVELAGALAEIGRHTLKDDFRHIDPRSVRVLLIEGRERLLAAFDPQLSADARRALEKLGVEVRTNERVTEVTDQEVTLASGERLPARTVLWAAGVQASALTQSLAANRDRAGRVEVQADLSLPDHPEVFVVGDTAKMLSAGKEVPGMAQGASQSGRHAARQILAELRGEPNARSPFRYRNLGSMATIGRASAIAEIGRWKQSGFFAWLFWWALHIYGLIGFRSRTSAFLNWGWQWLTFQRGARLITGERPELPEIGPADRHD